jgi:Fur family ferric uptake transcriptional regulator
LYCQQCGKVIEFQDPTIEDVIRLVGRQHNFQISSHTFIVRGTCADCNRARMPRRRLDLV